MKMHPLIPVLLLSFTASFTFGQTNYEKFGKLFKAKDTAAIKLLLTNWEKENPNDPELYTSSFNYYYKYSQQEILSLDQKPLGKEGFQLTDSTGNTAGYMNARTGYNPEKIDKAFFYISKGIEKFPDRLDMRFGKTYAYGQMEDYKKFTEEIIKTIEYSVTNKNNWSWTNNEKKEDAERFMLDAIHKYLKQLYNTEDDKLLENMKQAGGIAIRYYPNNIEILSITAVAHLLTDNFDVGIEYLKKAEQLNPKDFIVLNNIAHAYKLKGDKPNAIKYYELTEQYGDEQAKVQARKNINNLKN